VCSSTSKSISSTNVLSSARASGGLCRPISRTYTTAPYLDSTSNRIIPVCRSPEFCLQDYAAVELEDSRLCQYTLSI
jgi:hypothetical protein